MCTAAPDFRSSALISSIGSARPVRVLEIDMAARHLGEQATAPRMILVSAQFALLKTTESQEENGAATSESSPPARTKKAIGTTTRFASNEIRRDQVVIPEHQRQRADPGRERNGGRARASQVSALFSVAPARREQTSREKWIRCEAPIAENGSARFRKRIMAATTAKRELEADREKFVGIPAKNQGGGGRQAVESEPFRSTKKPPSKTALITAARTLEVCRPVMAE